MARPTGLNASELSMVVRILLFAAARELAGRRVLDMDLEAGSTMADLKGRLVAAFPRLGALSSHCLVAVNREYCSDDTILHRDDEIAVMPPVSGGGFLGGPPAADRRRPSDVKEDSRSPIGGQ